MSKFRRMLGLVVFALLPLVAGCGPSRSYMGDHGIRQVAAGHLDGHLVAFQGRAASARPNSFLLTTMYISEYSFSPGEYVHVDLPFRNTFIVKGQPTWVLGFAGRTLLLSDAKVDAIAVSSGGRWNYVQSWKPLIDAWSAGEVQLPITREEAERLNAELRASHPDKDELDRLGKIEQAEAELDRILEEVDKLKRRARWTFSRAGNERILSEMEVLADEMKQLIIFTEMDGGDQIISSIDEAMEEARQKIAAMK